MGWESWLVIGITVVVAVVFLYAMYRQFKALNLMSTPPLEPTGPLPADEHRKAD